jgi:hypothetical protein
MSNHRFGKAARLLAVTCAFVIPAVIICLLLWRLPGWERQVRQIPDAKERILTQNEIFRTFIQIAGGALLVAGFYFTWKTIRVTQEGQITDRFNKAIDHLGQENMSVRLGGIYALARIASDSERDAPTVTQVLAAFVREATAASSLATPAPDVKSILEILGSDEWAKGATKNLSGCKLRGLELINANLQNWILKDADLSEANLPGCRLDGATLVGTDLRHAYLRGCRLPGGESHGGGSGGFDAQRFESAIREYSRCRLQQRQPLRRELRRCDWRDAAAVRVGDLR